MTASLPKMYWVPLVLLNTIVPTVSAPSTVTVTVLGDGFTVVPTPLPKVAVKPTPLGIVCGLQFDPLLYDPSVLMFHDADPPGGATIKSMKPGSAVVLSE